MRWIRSIPPNAQDEKKERPFCSSYDIQQDEKAVLLSLLASQSEGSWGTRQRDCSTQASIAAPAEQKNRDFRLWGLSCREKPIPCLKTASSTKRNGWHWNTWASIFTGLLQAAACANPFNLVQGHITKPLTTCPKNSQIHVDRNSEYFCFICYKIFLGLRSAYKTPISLSGNSTQKSLVFNARVAKFPKFLTLGSEPTEETPLTLSASAPTLSRSYHKHQAASFHAITTSPQRLCATPGS